MERRAPRPSTSALRFERGRSPLRQRCRFAGRIVFRDLVVNLFGFVRLLPRLVEPRQLKLCRRFADDNRRLIDQLLVQVDCLRVPILCPIHRSKRQLAECRKVGVPRAGRLLQTALRPRYPLAVTRPIPRNSAPCRPCACADTCRRCPGTVCGPPWLPPATTRSCRTPVPPARLPVARELQRCGPPLKARRWPFRPAS